jgi:hypothetical protein
MGFAFFAFFAVEFLIVSGAVPDAVIDAGW